MENAVAIATTEEAVATFGAATSVAGKASDTPIFPQMNVEAEGSSSDRTPREDGASTSATGATVSVASLVFTTGSLTSSTLSREASARIPDVSEAFTEKGSPTWPPPAIRCLPAKICTVVSSVVRPAAEARCEAARLIPVCVFLFDGSARVN